MTGADASTTFTDESGKAWAASGNAQIDTAQFKFEGSSGLFDGAGDYIHTADNADFNFGSGNFTIDYWIRINATVSYPGIVTARVGNGWVTGLGDSNNRPRFVCDGSVITAVAVVPLSIWTHIAWVRNGTTIFCYVNGIQDQITWVIGAGAINSDAAGLDIGRLGIGTNNYYFNGWVDELRLSKGIARWTSDFIPPVYPYYPGGNHQATRGRKRYCGNVDPRISQ
jgi:hypothetical protein